MAIKVVEVRTGQVDDKITVTFLTAMEDQVIRFFTEQPRSLIEARTKAIPTGRFGTSQMIFYTNRPDTDDDGLFTNYRERVETLSAEAKRRFLDTQHQIQPLRFPEGVH